MNRTFRFSTVAFTFAAVVALSLMTSSSASAQSCRGGGGYYGGYGYTSNFNSYRPVYGRSTGISIGGGGISVGIGRSYGGYGGYNRGVSLSVYGSPYSGYNTYRRPVFHDTSHLDYYGPRLIRHGNHYDYVPGHYHLHRTGHWHR